MPDPKLVAYIDRHLKKGVHLDKIKKRLLDAGHKVIAVESAIGHVNHKRHLFRVLAVSGVIFVLMILGFVLQEQPEEIQSSSSVTQEPLPQPEVPSQPETSVYGLDTNVYDDRIAAAIATKDILICEKSIDRQDIREKCKELVQNE